MVIVHSSFATTSETTNLHKPSLAMSEYYFWHTPVIPRIPATVSSNLASWEIH